ncbi:MAG: transglycosylase domain-containing protein, partial [Caulobacteraceae bacterium]|nr:transglycosylase domain-containing protein [Caulobacteraceae bacterium]
MIPLLAALAFTAPDLPAPPPIRRDPQVTFVDRNGAFLGVRGGRYGPPADLAKLPAHVPAAFVAIEDRRFYSHAGFDPMSMARAVIADLGTGRVAQGGSTITQQLARNLYLTSERTLERKGQELLLAAELEQAYSKRQILGLYLSRIYFGSGAYGIEAASRRYFNKPAARLTLKEAAILAAIPKSPTNYDPAEQPERSAERAALVLAAMAETGAISQAERARAADQKPKVWRAAPAQGAQYFLDWLTAHDADLGRARGRDITVETTLDSAAETAAADAARAVVARHASQKVGQAALVALDGAGR